MNCQALIDTIMQKVQDPVLGRSWALERLNEAQVYLAGRLLLPGLADGKDTVTTLVDDNEVALPADYHRGLYMVTTAHGADVRLYASVGLIRDTGSPLNLDTGPVWAVTTLAGSLLYQRVPAVPVELELRYYRRPVALLDQDDSFPDGIAGYGKVENHFNRALMHYAYREYYADQEANGTTRTKADEMLSAYHDDQLRELTEAMDFTMGKARPRPAPTVCGVNW